VKKYTKVDVSEQVLEDLVRQNTGLIEEGLLYVDHQKQTGSGRLDVLMVDSGKALVVAELKVVQDDGMLLQGLDYYDYVSSQIESFARLYKASSIDPTREPRLFLIAPSFSQTLTNRCKWLDLPITLFTFNCLKFEGENDIVPIFTEYALPIPIEIVDISHIEDHLAYITDEKVRAQAAALLDEIRTWNPGNISLDAIKYSISMKIKGKLFAYLSPRRKHFLIATYDADDVWKEYAIHSEDELLNVKALIKAAMERRQ
jgi:hypothetical protein